MKNYDDYDALTLCDINTCDDCPRKGDDCDGNPSSDEDEDKDESYKEFFIEWDLDGVLFKFLPDGNIYRKLYFEELPEQKNIIRAAAMLDGMVLAGRMILRCGTLGSYLADSPHDVKAEKNNALDRVTDIPKERRIHIPCGCSKWEAVCERGLQDHCILIDDFGKNLSDWKGPYVKVSKNSLDRVGESLKHRFCISPDQEPEVIGRTILEAILASL